MNRWISPIVAIVDEALPNYASLRSAVLELPFADHVAQDGVSYPHVAELQGELREAFLDTIVRVMGPVVPKAVFARAMLEGMKAPNRIHTDYGFGQGSAILYCSAAPHSGTQFWNHTRFGQGVTTPVTFETNDSSDWTKGVFVPAVENRLLIHAANFFHSAEPTLGYGQDLQSARLVLTCFFDLPIHENKDKETNVPSLQP